ncbi:TPA: TrlF family AAA-like ATPase [Stenotrophomonas maltophilia]|uniref:TrlF family AAA-like ATPase n=1 Tax=Gammaproteobacteria TaxID=1236 RepID=UPI002A6AB613|nr:AAA family ATPase [Pseudomonas paraeruginosa]MDY1321239.1 AAA family ATPase [Pseudomonas paraeruginosa]
MMTKREISRGAVWRQWDLHVHTPASFHWSGERFENDLSSAASKKLVDEMIEAMNKAEPAVFAIMDYWTFDGWFALKQRLSDADAPKLTKKVFPGIELRLSAPTEKRLNAHVIFSDEIADQHLKDFLANLKIERLDRSVSKDALVDLARTTAADMLAKKGHKKEIVESDYADALLAGYKLAEVKTESYKNAIASVPNEFAIGFMPYDTSDGLTEVKWEQHYSYFLGLFESSPIFESRNLDLRTAFLCEKTSTNHAWIDNFKHGLKGIPRLVVAGSDAHCFVGAAGNDDKRGYGDFPSGKRTWIKADPTFHGLKQAILEPAKRSFIGDRPPKVQEVESNKTFYIESIEISKTVDKAGVGQWLHGCDIPLNPDLVAVIGNKGSGKSALADVIATLGNSKQSKHFSFLKKDRFWGKTGEPARHFTGTLTWRDESTESRPLNESPSEEKAELVRYIPQGYFEELCNEHVSGKSNAFEKELRSVIFSHASEEMRLGALDFDQLTEQQEQSLRNRLGEYRKELASTNADIVRIEEQLQPIELKKLTDLLLLKGKQIEEHDKLKPAEVAAPTEAMSPAQKQAAEGLAAATQQAEAARKRSQEIAGETTELAKRQKAIGNIREQLRLLQRSFDQAEKAVSDDIKLLGFAWTDLAAIEIKTAVLDQKSTDLATKQSEIKNEAEKLAEALNAVTATQQGLTAKLNAPQQQYEAYQRQLAEWNAKRDELIGSITEPETKVGLETRIEQIKELPQQLKDLEARRLQLSGEIFDTLDAQRRARAELFKPVQDLIQKNVLIREDYRLQFQATLAASADAIADQLFALIKQTSGDFRGQDDALATIRRLFDGHDLNTKDGALGFIASLHEKVLAAAKASGSDAGIFSLLKKGQPATAVYDLIFGLNFLEPRYSLLFQDTQIEQLSPGQRGALLLIFYLLVDKGKTPIILDQPEENLDNETVFRLLVPVLSEAKKQRQIIMVTHNPNLAVVCDAEQIIHARFDRALDSTISYESGAIENTGLNEVVVTILEGTKPAFENRYGKYH